MFRRLILAGLLIAWAAGPARAQRTGGLETIPTRGATQRLGLERQWHTLVPLIAGHDRVLHFNVDGGILFVETSAGFLHAYDAESGRALWSRRLGPASAQGHAVSVRGDTVAATNLKTIYALDRASGRQLWSAEMPDLPSTGTALDDQFAMVGLRSGKLVGFNLIDRSKQDPPGRSAGTFAWAWQTGAELSSRPIATEHVIAFGSRDSRVYVASKGEADIDARPLLLYRFLTAGPISANLGVWGNRTLIVPSADNNVYAIDLFDGRLRWSYPMGSPVDQEPLVSGDMVYAISETGRVAALDGRTGSAAWERATGAERLLALSPSRIYLETQDHDLVILDRASGQVVADARGTVERAGLDLRNFTLGFPNYQNDRLYFCTPSGLLVCLREIGRTRPTPLRDPSQPPFGTIPPEGFATDEDVPPNATAAPAPDGEIPMPGEEGEVPVPGDDPADAEMDNP